MNITREHHATQESGISPLVQILQENEKTLAPRIPLY